MSVINDKTHDLIVEFNELESKVLIVLEQLNSIEKRLKKIEACAKKAGVDLTPNDTLVEGDTCTIN